MYIDGVSAGFHSRQAETTPQSTESQDQQRRDKWMCPTCVLLSANTLRTQGPCMGVEVRRPHIFDHVM